MAPFSMLVRNAIASGLLCWSIGPLWAATILTGTVVAVHDGDTLTLQTAPSAKVQVRLADIDAPELGQPFGTEAKRALTALCLGKHATVQQRQVDQHGRVVGVVQCEDQDASIRQVERGMAWAYRQYLLRISLLETESVAKSAHAGLWSAPAVEPWVYRKAAKPASPAVTAIKAPPAAYPRNQVADLAPEAPGNAPPLSLAEMFEHHKTATQIIEERGNTPSDGMVLGAGSRGPLQTGPRGGVYYLNQSGNKVYLKR